MKPRLARSSARILGAVVAGLLLMAVALTLYSVPMPGESFRGTAPPLDEDARRVAAELRRHVTKLSVDIGERRATAGDSLQRAESYLHDELAILTALPGVSLRREALENAPGNAANLVLELPGTQTTPLVLIGAHYDSAPGGTPAANDNGSGTASALVLAARLAHAKRTLPIRIVLFANEELPYFGAPTMGSLQHAQGCKRRGEHIRAMFSLETLGYYSDAPGSQQYPAPLSSLYPDRGNFIAFVGNLASRSLLRETIGSFRSHASIPSEGGALPAALPGVGWSDHWSFWQNGYAAVMVTDTALFRDPNYHELSDVVSNLDFERLTRVVIALQATILDFRG